MPDESESLGKNTNQGSNHHSDQNSSKQIKEKSKKNALKIILVLVVTFLLFITVYISGIRHKHESEILRIRRDYAHQHDKDAAIKKIKSERVEFFIKQAFLNHPGRYAFAAANFIRNLTLITPGNLNLLELILKPLDQNISFFLKGQVYGVSRVKNRKILTEFYRQLSSMDEVVRIFTSPLQSTDRDQEPLEFFLKGELEVE